jgi:hypothetical protein
MIGFEVPDEEAVEFARKHFGLTDECYVTDVLYDNGQWINSNRSFVFGETLAKAATDEGEKLSCNPISAEEILEIIEKVSLKFNVHPDEIFLYVGSVSH